jgi:3-hydroxy-9,10-secoandrosta-1,3,5(10)-triene-9,17-dione monooxygenase reductase component
MAIPGEDMPMPSTSPSSTAATFLPGAASVSSEFRRFFRLDARGVAVVTASGTDGPSGLTVTSFCALSAEPPLLLACLTNNSRTLRHIQSTRVFAFHLLRGDQGRLCELFASQEKHKSSLFAGLDFVTLDGAPVLADTLAWTVCQLRQSLRAGDHTIVIGQLTRIQRNPGVPLVWQASRQCEVTMVNDPLCQ